MIDNATEQYPRVLICRSRHEASPDVWLCEWVVNYQEHPDHWCIVDSYESRPSAEDLYELSTEYDCPVVVEDTPMGRPAGRTA